MYLNMDEQKYVDKIKAQIRNKERRILELEKELKKVSYSGIVQDRHHIATFTGGGSAAASIRGEIHREEKAIQKLKDDLSQFYKRMAEEFRRINAGSREEEERVRKNEERLKTYDEKKSAFRNLESRWKYKGFLYKMFHLRTRPNKIYENLDDMSLKEINSLHRL